ncbi:unnamed protein product, partial [Iphiclides podalirius]
MNFALQLRCGFRLRTKTVLGKSDGDIGNDVGSVQWFVSHPSPPSPAARASPHPCARRSTLSKTKKEAKGQSITPEALLDKNRRLDRTIDDSCAETERRALHACRNANTVRGLNLTSMFSTILD